MRFSKDLEFCLFTTQPFSNRKKGGIARDDITNPDPSYCRLFCCKPRALHGVQNLNDWRHAACFFFFRFAGKSKPRVSRVVVYAASQWEHAIFFYQLGMKPGTKGSSNDFRLKVSASPMHWDDPRGGHRVSLQD
jgi:hypothetical protein